MHGDENRGLDTTIRAVLEPYTDVEAGYLFGSACTGRHGPLSDIDVAVLLHAPSRRTSIEGEVQDDLCRALRTDRVDLVSLVNAPPSLVYHVIRDGRCIYCRNAKARECFETDTVMRYLDFKPFREQAFRDSRDRILEKA